jgi:hypothetical protein
MAHNINQKKPHGGKVKGFAPADGNAPDTGMPVTPAPTKKLAPDVISAPKNPASVGGYGMNASGLANPSSIPPGTRLNSKMADVLAEGQDDGEGALETIVREGTSKRDDMITGQLRKIAEGNVPTVRGMKRQTTGDNPYDFGELPKTIGSSAAQPVRKPI